LECGDLAPLSQAATSQIGLPKKVSGYAVWCAEGLWPSGKSAIPILGYAHLLGRSPEFIATVTEAQSASAHQAA